MLENNSLAQLASVLLPLVSAVVVALVALIGNHWLQRRLGKRLRDLTELKTHLYRLITLSSQYWARDDNTKSGRQELEALIIAEQHIVRAQLMEMGNQTRRLKRWYDRTAEHRLNLTDAITGGCFQQTAWSPDPVRVTLAAREIQLLIESLNLKF
ncbi:MAG: hypothetical protein OXJ90_05170 [Spirochaetaceae bacterium]|nr:hypothetical protein [Spirochaetaceae bacterium]